MLVVVPGHVVAEAGPIRSLRASPQGFPLHPVPRNPHKPVSVGLAGDRVAHRGQMPEELLGLTGTDPLPYSANTPC